MQVKIKISLSSKCDVEGTVEHLDLDIGSCSCCCTVAFPILDIHLYCARIHHGFRGKKAGNCFPYFFFHLWWLKKKAWSSFPFNRSSACAPSLSPTPLKHSVAKHADYFSCPRRASSKGQMQYQPAKLPWLTGDLDFGPISETGIDSWSRLQNEANGSCTG